MSKQKINKLTGLPLSAESLEVLDRLEANEQVSLDEIRNLKEMKEAYSCVSESKPTADLKNREGIQHGVLQKLNQMGSAVIDENGIAEYNGDVGKDSRIDIVIGLPASGKSSAIVNPLSQEFHSKIIDNDEAKKLIPEFNQGWGAGVVHKESQKIAEWQLRYSIAKGENIILPKVGSDMDKLVNTLHDLKAKDYHIFVHYVDLPPNKALGRMLNRFFEQGRFLDPKLVFKYGDKVNTVYEQLKLKGELIDGYSKWSNDVKEGERPICIESSFQCAFIRKARTSPVVNDNLRNAGRERAINLRDATRDGHSKREGRMSKESGGISKKTSLREVKKPSILAQLKDYKSKLNNRQNKDKDRNKSKSDRQESR